MLFSLFQLRFYAPSRLESAVPAALRPISNFNADMKCGTATDIKQYR